MHPNTSESVIESKVDDRFSQLDKIISQKRIYKNKNLIYTYANIPSVQ